MSKNTSKKTQLRKIIANEISDQKVPFEVRECFHKVDESIII